jgi:hypothetical protein
MESKKPGLSRPAQGVTHIVYSKVLRIASETNRRERSFRSFYYKQNQIVAIAFSHQKRSQGQLD